jgi:hypothetical protein
MAALGQCGVAGMMASGNGAAGALGINGSGQNGIGGPGNGKYEEIQGQVPKGGKGYLTKSSSAMGNEGMIFQVGTAKGAPDKAGSSKVPYYEVLSDYKKAAEHAMSNEKVPPAYRKTVSDYFGSLNK